MCIVSWVAGTPTRAFDLLSALPSHLAVYVLGFLQVRQLKVAALVSPGWAAYVSCHVSAVRANDPCRLCSQVMNDRDCRRDAEDFVLDLKPLTEARETERRFSQADAYVAMSLDATKLMNAATTGAHR
jgi:hypothetical protein